MQRLNQVNYQKLVQLNTTVHKMIGKNMISIPLIILERFKITICLQQPAPHVFTRNHNIDGSALSTVGQARPVARF